MDGTERRSLSTGIPGLDEDIRSLFEFCETENLPKLRKALETQGVSADDIVKMVPEGVVRLVLGLGPGQYGVLLDKVGEGGRPALEKAKRLVDENLGVLSEYPKGRAVLKKGVERLVEGAEHAEESALATALNTVRGVSALATYVGTPPELVPCLRVALTAKHNRLLLDTLMDWDDLTHVTGNLTELLAEAMAEAKLLAEKGQLAEIPERTKTKLAQRLNEMEAHLRTIRQLAPFYGIELEEGAGGRSEESGQSSSSEEEKATQGD